MANWLAKNKNRHLKKRADKRFDLNKFRATAASSTDTWLGNIVKSIFGVSSMYGDGSDGIKTLTGNESIAAGVYQYSSLTIAGAWNLTCSTADSSLIILVDGPVTISDVSASINVDGNATTTRGGGPSNGGNGIGEICGLGGGNTGVQIGGGMVRRFGDESLGSITGTAVAAASIYFSAVSNMATILYLAKENELYGSGGGSDGAANTGGPGAPALVLICRTLNSVGTISADGGSATGGAANAGGGGGGIVVAYSDTWTAAGTITASGGAKFANGYVGSAGRVFTLGDA